MFSDKSTLYLIIISALVILVLYIVIVAYKETKKLNLQNDELKSKLKKADSALSESALSNIKKDNQIKDLIYESKNTIAQKDTEIQAIINSNLAATEKIRNFYYAHSGRELKGANTNPSRMELYITDVLFHLSCQFQKGDTTFDKIILKNKPIADWYGIYLDDFTHKVYIEYINKGYSVKIFNDDTKIIDEGLEKYLLAENDIHILLIQCVYMELKYSLNPESIYALHSTYYKLLKNTDKKLIPVLICSASISDESKHLLQTMDINYRENAIPEIHKIN